MIAGSNYMGVFFKVYDENIFQNDHTILDISS